MEDIQEIALPCWLCGGVRDIDGVASCSACTMEGTFPRMAAYIYLCPTCHEVTEKRFPIGTAPERSECPACLVPAQRRFTSPAVSFKGSGFYTTDKAKP